MVSLKLMSYKYIFITTTRAIHIDSVNREKIGNNSSHDCIIQFSPVLKLDPEMKHEIAM